MYNLLIIGGGPAGITCAQVLGSASNKPYMADKKIAMIAYNKTSDLNAAILNNVYGVAFNTKGKDLLNNSLEQIKQYQNIEQLAQNPIISVKNITGGYEVKTAENSYQAEMIVLAIGHNNKIAQIEGLESFATTHTNSLPGVEKTALKHSNNLITEGLYAAGLTANCASQAAIAAGHGAEVAVQILTKWNDNTFDHHHDK